MKTVIVKQLTQEDFDSLEKDWSELLSTSNADPLFMSWIWLHTWWNIFSSENNYELKLLAAYDDTNSLIGVAPLYTSVAHTRLGKIRRIQFLGNSWRLSGNIRSEYIDFICEAGNESNITSAFIAKLDNMKNWDELIINNHNLDSEINNGLYAALDQYKYYYRTVEVGVTQQIDTKGNFDTYLKNLSSKTRSTLYNQRKKLKAHGDVILKYAGPDDVENYINILNGFHRARWGKELFSNARLEFHRSVAKELAKRNMLQMSLLSVNNKPISILYDFVVNNHKYGYQLGFDDTFDKKISISKLHFGYAIEHAFTSDIERYDFLRGIGFSGQSYKHSMTTPFRTTASIQVLRKPLHKLIHRTALFLRSLKSTK